MGWVQDRFAALWSAVQPEDAREVPVGHGRGNGAPAPDRLANTPGERRNSGTIQVGIYEGPPIAYPP
jgi:hypothetical protein